jgi:hypothetical protein
MYPAQAVNTGLITWEDLPQEVEVFYDNGASSLTMQRLEPPIEDSGIIVYYEETGNGYNEGENYIYSESGETNYTVFLGGSLFAALCLFQQPPDDFRIQDLFEDAYAITTPYSSGTVNRASLCLWEGIDDNGCAILLRYNDAEHNWQVSFADFNLQSLGCETGLLATKQGNQDTPVGTHTDLIAGVSVTVA